MNKSEVESTLKRIISEIFEIPIDKISNDFNHQNVEEWDSMNHINLVVSVEEEFGIEIEEDKILDLMSFQALSDYIVSAVSEK